MLSKRIQLALALLAALFFGLFASSSIVRAGEVCEGVPFNNGWLRFDVTSGVPAPDFTGGLLGLFEADSLGGPVSGDLDWFYNSEATGTQYGPGTNTTTSGVQLIGWWTQKGGRNTVIQLTNHATASEHFSEIGGLAGGVPCSSGDPGCEPAPLSIHVQILDESCAEIKDFCDSFTPQDTHVYDFGDLVTNTGQDITESVLQGKEGIVVITPVVACGADNRAINFDPSGKGALLATERIQDATNDIEYGVNLYEREVAFGEGTCSTVNNGSADILDGTNCFFETGISPNLVLMQNFSQDPATVAVRSDVVLLSIQDDYSAVATQGYTPLPAFATYFPDIYDADENVESCPQFTVCFARLGVDDSIPESDVALPTPTPTPTPTPSPTPSGGGTESPSPSPTGGGGGGGGGSCAIGGVVGAGTAAANVALPLLLPAFAVGLGVLRRRGRKGSRR